VRARVGRAGGVGGEDAEVEVVVARGRGAAEAGRGGFRTVFGRGVVRLDEPGEAGAEWGGGGGEEGRAEGVEGAEGGD